MRVSLNSKETEGQPASVSPAIDRLALGTPAEALDAEATACGVDAGTTDAQAPANALDSDKEKARTINPGDPNPRALGNPTDSHADLRMASHCGVRAKTFDEGAVDENTTHSESRARFVPAQSEGGVVLTPQRTDVLVLSPQTDGVVAPGGTAPSSSAALSTAGMIDTTDPEAEIRSAGKSLNESVNKSVNKSASKSALANGVKRKKAREEASSTSGPKENGRKGKTAKNGTKVGSAKKEKKSKKEARGAKGGKGTREEKTQIEKAAHKSDGIVVHHGVGTPSPRHEADPVGPTKDGHLDYCDASFSADAIALTLVPSVNLCVAPPVCELFSPGLPSSEPTEREASSANPSPVGLPSNVLSSGDISPAGLTQVDLTLDVLTDILLALPVNGFVEEAPTQEPVASLEQNCQRAIDLLDGDNEYDALLVQKHRARRGGLNGQGARRSTVFLSVADDGEIRREDKTPSSFSQPKPSFGDALASGSTVGDPVEENPPTGGEVSGGEATGGEAKGGEAKRGTAVGEEAVGESPVESCLAAAALMSHAKDYPQGDTCETGNNGQAIQREVKDTPQGEPAAISAQDSPVETVKISPSQLEQEAADNILEDVLREDLVPAVKTRRVRPVLSEEELEVRARRRQSDAAARIHAVYPLALNGEQRFSKRVELRGLIPEVGEVAFATLASGSAANATVLWTESSSLLVDAGLSWTQLLRRGADAGLLMTELAHLVITHGHADHVAGVKGVLRHTRALVWVSSAVAAQLQINGHERVRIYAPGDVLACGDWSVTTVEASHDAKETSVVRVRLVDDAGQSVAIVTDLGHVTPGVLELMRGVRAVVIEANHDLELLAHSRYPAALKERVRSDLGHLSNQQAAAALASIMHQDLQVIVLAHLSSDTNTAAAARTAVTRRLAGKAFHGHLRLAWPDRVSGPWRLAPPTSAAAWRGTE